MDEKTWLEVHYGKIDKFGNNSPQIYALNQWNFILEKYSSVGIGFASNGIAIELFWADWGNNR
jgi:hypothetical protein